MIADGEIVSLLNAHVRRIYSYPGVTCLPLTDAPRTEWALVWLERNKDPLVRAFVDTAQQLGPRPVRD